MFTFTSLLGSQSSSRVSQSILEFDGGGKVLVDVGWKEGFDTRQLGELEKHVSTLSFILLTHATTSHLGAFAHCCKHIPTFAQVPVYATSPVIAFGRTLLQDLYSSTPLAATFISSLEDEAGNSTQRSYILRQAPTFEEINKYFSSITPLKYSQPYQPTTSPFSAPLEGLTLTAYNSGHTLGGTIWHIQHGMESIVYAVDWNQARENVIAGAAWFGGVDGSEVIEQLRRPTALICSSVGGDKAALSGGRKTRDDALLGHIRSSIAKGGVVLIPTDSSARILELAWILEKAWQESMSDPVLKSTKVYMASKSGNATLRHARSLLEWMDDSIVRGFEGDDENSIRTHQRTGSKQANGTSKLSRPFEFRHVKMIERIAQLEKVLKGEGPRVILASDLSLDWGLSRAIFEQIAQNPVNLVIQTERPGLSTANHSLGLQLWQWYENREDGVALEKTQDGLQLEQVHCGGRVVAVRVADKMPLNDAESQQYQQYVATRRQMHDALLPNPKIGEDAADDNIDDDTSSSSSDESDDEQQGRALNVSAALGHGSRSKVVLSDEDLGVSILVRKKDVYDYDVRNKKGRNAVFPYTHSRKRGDDFGDFIKPEDFLREEEKDVQDGQADGKLSGNLGQKRKWDDATTQKKSEGPNKRQQVRNGKKGASTALVDEDPSSDESEESDVEGIVESEQMRGPAKIVYSSRDVAVNARLAFVDFAGLHDQRSLQMLIPLIGAKKLILTGGSAQETSTLASDCKELLNTRVVGAEADASTEIFTPKDGQTVDASVDTNAWIVTLSRSLAKRLNWQNVKNMAVVTLQGHLKGEPLQTTNIDEETKSKKQKLDATAVETAPSSAVQPVLDAIPATLAGSTRSVNQPILVGDMRLADLRRIMNLDGHAAEFRGEGTLLVDGMIAVKKLGTGKIIVEGAPVSILGSMTPRHSDSFTQVKRRIYEGLAVVAAG